MGRPGAGLGPHAPSLRVVARAAARRGRSSPCPALRRPVHFVAGLLKEDRGPKAAAGAFFMAGPCLWGRLPGGLMAWPADSCDNHAE